MVGDDPVRSGQPLGPLIQSFFVDHLVTVKGLRPTSVRSYRDTIKLLLSFVARDNKSRITKLTVEDLTFERVVGFLRYLEDERHNHVRTRTSGWRLYTPCSITLRRGSPRCSPCVNAWPPSP
jgi:hypothetical protein